MVEDGLDPAAVMAEHDNPMDSGRGVDWCYACWLATTPDVHCECLPYRLASALVEFADLIRDVAMDWGDKCDHPADCGCSMARLIRTARDLGVLDA